MLTETYKFYTIQATTAGYDIVDAEGDTSSYPCKLGMTGCELTHLQLAKARIDSWEGAHGSC